MEALGEIDRQAFGEDSWVRPGGGGGRSRVLEAGEVFERAGVNVSEVHGELSPQFAATLPGEGLAFYATGVSLVLHPRNPFAPTVHANFRYFEKGGASWFGGGADLTPSYLFEEDAVHFHSVFKGACDRHSPATTRSSRRAATTTSSSPIAASGAASAASSSITCRVMGRRLSTS